MKIKFLEKTMTLTLLMCTSFFVGCSSMSNVYENERGYLVSEHKAPTKREAFRTALSEARNFCRREEGRFVMAKKNLKYDGEIKEDAHKVMGRVSNISSLLGKSKIANVSNEISGDSGYISTIWFKCKRRRGVASR